MTTESPQMVSPAIISDSGIEHATIYPQEVITMSSTERVPIEACDPQMIRIRQLAKSDIDLNARIDESSSSSSPPSGNRRRSKLRTDQYNIVQVKRVNSFANTFESVAAQTRTNQECGNGKRKLHGRADSPVVCNRISVPVYDDRPMTCEEEIKDEMTKLRYVIFQMHQKLMSEKKLNKRLTEQMKNRESEFQDVLNQMKTKHDNKIITLKETVMVMLSKSSREKTDLEEQNSLNKSSWLAEKKILESNIEKLLDEIDQNKIELSENKDSKTEITPEMNSASEFQTNSTTSKKNASIPPSIIHSSDQIATTEDQQQQQQQQHSDGWNDLYKILYDISIMKLTALENKRNETYGKESFSKSLINYGYFHLFNDVAGSQDRISESNSGHPDNTFSDHPRLVRRSSSCPYLAEMVENISSNPESHQTPTLEVCSTQPEPSDEVVQMRVIIEKFIAPRPMSIPLSIEHRSICGMNPSSGSPSPRDSSPASVFNRQKVQYRHVCRQPKRTLERQERSLPLTGSTTNSLPVGSNTSQMEDCVNEDDHSTLAGKSSVQSNFERLCHRRNGLINPDFKLKQQRHTNVMDKLGQNLRQYIGHNKDQKGGL